MGMGWSYDAPPPFNAGEAINTGLNQGFQTGLTLTGQNPEIIRQILQNKMLQQELYANPIKLQLLQEQIKAQAAYRDMYGQFRKAEADKLNAAVAAANEQRAAYERSPEGATSAAGLGQVPIPELAGPVPFGTLNFAAPKGTAESQMSPAEVAAAEKIRQGVGRTWTPGQVNAAEQIRQFGGTPSATKPVVVGKGGMVYHPDTRTWEQAPAEKGELSDMDKAKLGEIQARTNEINLRTQALQQENKISAPDKARLKSVQNSMAVLEKKFSEGGATDSDRVVLDQLMGQQEAILGKYEKTAPQASGAAGPTSSKEPLPPPPAAGENPPTFDTVEQANQYGQQNGLKPGTTVIIGGVPHVWRAGPGQ